MKNQQQMYKTDTTDKKENLKSKDKYNIILQLYKGLTDNLEILGEKIINKNSSTEVSQVAYKVDKIAAGLQYTLDFENEKTLKISENFRELYRHIRFSMKMIYENQDSKLLDSSRNIAKVLHDSWAQIKPKI
tara:strand:- start:66 stop:461 length:396 start_codon:yes stop_codon:yes gene_type:complete